MLMNLICWRNREMMQSRKYSQNMFKQNKNPNPTSGTFCLNFTEAHAHRRKLQKSPKWLAWL